MNGYYSPSRILIVFLQGVGRRFARTCLSRLNMSFMVITKALLVLYSLGRNQLVLMVCVYFYVFFRDQGAHRIKLRRKLGFLTRNYVSEKFTLPGNLASTRSNSAVSAQDVRELSTRLLNGISFSQKFPFHGSIVR